MQKGSSMLNIVLLSCGHALNDFYNNFLPVLLPVLIVKFDFSLAISGLLVMVLSITANLVQPFFGYYFDRHNMGRVLLFAIPLGGVIICSVGYLTEQYMVFFMLALLGITVSSFHPLASSIIGKITDDESRGKSMSYFVAGGNIGFAAAPIVVVCFLEHLQIEQLPWLTLPAFLLLAGYLWSGVYKIPSATRSADDEMEQPSIVSALKNWSVVKLNLAMGLRCWTHMSISTFLPLLILKNGYSAVAGGLILTLFLMGSSLGGLIGGYLGDKLNHKRVLVVSLGISAVPAYLFLSSEAIDAVSLIALFLSGALVQAGQPSSIVWSQRLMPEFTGVASGMMMGMSFGLGSIGAAITAAIGDVIGLSASLLLSILPVALGCLLIVITPYEEK